MCGGRVRVVGIPIQEHIHDQFPQNVKDAWVKFDEWWSNQTDPISRKNMPTEISEAYSVMKEAPIHGLEEWSGKDSCYIIEAENRMVD